MNVVWGRRHPSPSAMGWVIRIYGLESRTWFVGVRLAEQVYDYQSMFE